MHVWAFGAASAVNVLALFVHVLQGGRTFVRPLLASGLAAETKWMAYFMWHVATVAVAATAMLFGFAAAGNLAFGLFATGFAASIALLALGVSIKSGLGPARFPIIMLNAFVVVLGSIGLVTA